MRFQRPMREGRFARRIEAAQALREAGEVLAKLLGAGPRHCDRREAPLAAEARQPVAPQHEVDRAVCDREQFLRTALPPDFDAARREVRVDFASRRCLMNILHS